MEAIIEQTNGAAVVPFSTPVGLIKTVQQIMTEFI
ncbi:MAG: hypothetical protein C5S41_04150 [Candidatus Methanomarinus sp.]|nr:MAG: hypothetical protein C5S41_04150 [ANME-2 cluster archaeon]KAF5426679.1 hypothetical protein C5S42_06950 [ANME-2 cluster archaeon]